MHRFANPARFLKIAGRIRPFAALVAVLTLIPGLYFALIASPPDYQQGDTVRIMYIHVPSAWLAMAGYSTMALASAVALVWRHPVAELTARSAAPIGATFTLLCLVTGSLWGKPMWGTWWVWDARLTSVLVLFFLYLGYIVLADAFDDPERGGRAAGLLAIVGAVNVPIIKFSVDWWNTLHQPASVMKLDGPSIHPDMLLPLGLMAVGFTAAYAWLLLRNIEASLLERKLRMAELAGLDLAR